jgi:hypothetical protein
MANTTTAPSLDELCDRLRRDDPDLTNVDLTRPAYHGHGVRLGQALLQNSHVVTLTLAVEALVDENEVVYASHYPLLQYLRTNLAIRETVLVGCPSPLQNRQGRPEIVHLRGLVLDAIAQNSHIVTLQCFHRIPINPMTKLLTDTTSLTDVLLYTHTEHTNDSSLLQRFKDAVSLNQTVKKLFLMNASNNSDKTNDFLLPLAMNSSVRMLLLHYSRHCNHAPSGLYRLLHSATSTIAGLVINNALFDISSWSLLCDALRGNLSVQVLSFQSCSIEVPQRSMLDCVRENGCLRDVQYGSSLSIDGKVRAYCQRNVILPVLLANEFVHGRAVSMSLLPLFLAAAQQAPRTAPNLILLALLAIPSDDIGVRPTGKRSCTSMDYAI